MLSRTYSLLLISAIYCSVSAYVSMCGYGPLSSGQCYNPRTERRRICKRTDAKAFCPGKGRKCCVHWVHKVKPKTERLCESRYKGKCLSFEDGKKQGCIKYITHSDKLCKGKTNCCIAFKKTPKPTEVPIIVPPTKRPEPTKASIVRPKPTKEPVVPPTDEQDCGIPDFPIKGDKDWRIVLGETSHKGSWSWQVSLTDLSGWHFCGGSIIDNEWILTAAHCINRKKPRYVNVVVGQLTRHKYEESRKIHEPAIFIMHPHFDKHTKSASPNDIGLIKLRDPIRYDEHVKPICLPRHHKEGHFDGHQECWITGWGDTRGTANSAYLQQLKTKAWSYNACARHWSFFLRRSMICVGNMKQGACGGDSGGPMVCRENGKFYQAGLTSFGTKYCRGAPSVYTRVTSFMSWINDIRQRY